MLRNSVFYGVLIMFLLLSLRGMDMIAGQTVFRTDDTFYRPEPGSYIVGSEHGLIRLEINSLGIRNPELGPRGNATRVLYLGDSFTLGSGVAEPSVFVRRSERILQTRGHSIEQINAGIIAYSPANSLGLYRAIESSVQPDTVILVLYQNDVNDSGETPLYKRMRSKARRRPHLWLAFALAPKTSDYFFRRQVMHDFQEKIRQLATPVRRIEQGPGPLTPPPPPPRPDPGAIRAQLSFIVTAYAQHMQLEPVRTSQWLDNATAYLARDGLQGVDAVQLLYGLFEPEYFRRSIDLAGEGQHDFERMGAAIRELHAEVRDRGRAFGMVYIPSEVMYNAGKAARARLFGFEVRDEWREGETTVEKELTRFAEAEQIPFLNLSIAFREASPNNDFTLPRDMHFSSRGHAEAARLIAGFLEEHFLAPTDHRRNP